MNKKQILSQLWNGIQNDYSIRHFTLGWKDVIDSIESKIKNIQEDVELQFERSYIIEAINISKGPLLRNLEAFARELEMNLETYAEKSI